MSSSERFNIEPKNIVTTKVVTNIDISVQELILHQGCRIRVYLRGADGSIIDIQHVEMFGDDYKAWGNDDNYCLNYIASKLGISPVV
jgi:hypothetical protein